MFIAHQQKLITTSSFFVRNNPKRCDEKSAETVGKRNNDPIYD